MLLLIGVAVATAQKKTPRVSWYAMPSLSLLNGDKVSVAASASSGIQYKRWHFGIGAGIDYYRIRTVPLFGEIKYELTKPASPFLYVQGGYNVAWALESQYFNHYDYSPVWWSRETVYNNGWYAAGGLGCYLFRKGKQGVACSLGYSLKTLPELSDEMIWTGAKYVTQQRKTVYTFRRIALNIAYRF
jgi:hypothetical protein